MIRKRRSVLLRYSRIVSMSPAFHAACAADHGPRAPRSRLSVTLSTSGSVAARRATPNRADRRSVRASTPPGFSAHRRTDRGDVVVAAAPPEGLGGYASRLPVLVFEHAAKGRACVVERCNFGRGNSRRGANRRHGIRMSEPQNLGRRTCMFEPAERGEGRSSLVGIL